MPPDYGNRLGSKHIVEKQKLFKYKFMLGIITLFEMEVISWNNYIKIGRHGQSQQAVHKFLMPTFSRCVTVVYLT
jgi:hypothetical protein